MGKKTAANYVIEKNASGILEDTAPELALEELFSTLSVFKLVLEKVKVISVEDADGKSYDLRPDRRVRGTNVLLHVDGDYHETIREENKDHWKDGLLNKAGERNLHVRAELLTTKRFWGYTAIMIDRFMRSTEPNLYLFA